MLGKWLLFFSIGYILTQAQPVVCMVGAGSRPVTPSPSDAGNSLYVQQADESDIDAILKQFGYLQRDVVHHWIQNNMIFICKDTVLPSNANIIGAILFEILDQEHSETLFTQLQEAGPNPTRILVDCNKLLYLQQTPCAPALTRSQTVTELTTNDCINSTSNFSPTCSMDIAFIKMKYLGMKEIVTRNDRKFTYQPAARLFFQHKAVLAATMSILERLSTSPKELFPRTLSFVLEGDADKFLTLNDHIKSISPAAHTIKASSLVANIVAEKNSESYPNSSYNNSFLYGVYSLFETIYNKFLIISFNLF